MKLTLTEEEFASKVFDAMTKVSDADADDKTKSNSELKKHGFDDYFKESAHKLWENDYRIELIYGICDYEELTSDQRYQALSDIKELVYCRLAKHYKDNKKIIEDLIKCGDFYINKETLPNLTQAKADVFTQVGYGHDTLLHYVAKYGNTENVKALIDSCNPQEIGIFINQKNSCGHTSLHTAARWGNTENVKYLITKGADVNVKSNFKYTPLHLASEFGNAKTIKALITEGADVNAKDNSGNTALHLAVECGNVKVIKALIKKGADVNAKDNNDNTALHCATTKDQCDAARVLIKGGAELYIKNNSNKTPLDSCKTKKLKAELMFIKADKQITDFITPGLNVLVDAIYKLKAQKDLIPNCQMFVNAISKLNCCPKRQRTSSDKYKITEEDRGRY